MNRKHKVIVALDVSNVREAKQMLHKLKGVIKIFKVGSELFTAAGPEIIRCIHEQRAKVFLDLKFHDIPNTVAHAVRTASQHRVFMLNVHASGGTKMMQAAHNALRGSHTKPILIAVTVLTSMQSQDLRETGLKVSSNAQVLKLAQLTKKAGLKGVVCSGQEVKMIRKRLGKRFVIVTPGVRPAWAVKGDQKRVTTPEAAFKQGADYIVIGRPITQDSNPREAAKRILSTL